MAIDKKDAWERDETPYVDPVRTAVEASLAMRMLKALMASPAMAEAVHPALHEAMANLDSADGLEAAEARMAQRLLSDA